MICDECETVAHCMKNGCVPKTNVQQDIPDLIAGTLGVSRGTAYDMMREALADAQPQQEQDADHEFKNFHRTMCERFGYTHDERDWKRDQVSLIEWIAKKVEQPAQQEPRKQEPVAWMQDSIELYVQDHPSEYYTIPLYTSPPASNQCRFPLCQNEDYQQALAEQIKQELYTGEPAQRKPLTDDEIYKLCRNEGDEHSTCFIFNKDGTWSVLTLARAIEAAHGIKENT